MTSTSPVFIYKMDPHTVLSIFKYFEPCAIGRVSAGSSGRHADIFERLTDLIMQGWCIDALQICIERDISIEACTFQ